MRQLPVDITAEQLQQDFGAIGTVTSAEAHVRRFFSFLVVLFVFFSFETGPAGRSGVCSCHRQVRVRVRGPERNIAVERHSVPWAVCDHSVVTQGMNTTRRML